jgi:hypothetical protein
MFNHGETAAERDNEGKEEEEERAKTRVHKQMEIH